MSKFEENDELIKFLYIRITELSNFIKDLNILWEKIEFHEKEYYEFDHSLKVAFQTEKEWGKFTNDLMVSNTIFLKKITSNTPNKALTPKNIKMCAYIRMGLTNKEIAEILQISPNSVKRTQTRLKEKFKLDHNTTLRKFIYSL